MAVGDFGKLVALMRNQMMATLDEALKSFDLTGSQYAVMKQIADGKADTLARLCEILQHDKGAMSRIISRMEDKALLVRKPCPDDGRAFKLALSERGLALFPQTVPLVHGVFDKALQGFSEAEKEQLFNMLIRCHRNLS